MYLYQHFHKQHSTGHCPNVTYSLKSLSFCFKPRDASMKVGFRSGPLQLILLCQSPKTILVSQPENILYDIFFLLIIFPSNKLCHTIFELYYLYLNLQFLLFLKLLHSCSSKIWRSPFYLPNDHVVEFLYKFALCFPCLSKNLYSDLFVSVHLYFLTAFPMLYFPLLWI